MAGDDAQAVLPPNQHLAAPGKWPVVGERAPRADGSPWTVSIEGLVLRPRVFALAELVSLGMVERAVDIHCVTRWSILGARFQGVPLARVLEECGLRPEARFARFVARSERAHSTSLPLEDALELGVLIAVACDGRPLEEIHGGPVRIVTPGRYFYKSLKWLERVELLAQDRLGYWEAEAGYHNRADPWREERYIAPSIDRRILRRALESRDFRGLDLRGLDARGRALQGLQAAGALLRDADFRRSDLTGADFSRTNLSNARFDGATLAGASFRDADLEGTSLHGADLRRADLRGASLLGATFCAAGGAEGARVDASTRVSPEALEMLAPLQADWLLRFHQ